MDARHLSKRLAAVAAFVPDEARLADIGSDHGYLPANLVLTDRIDFAVAGEVAKGPYGNLAGEIKRLNLADHIHPRLADGLAAVTVRDRVDTVTIAGMGGSLIAHILAKGLASLSTVHCLVLEPNIGAFRVRQWLMNHQWAITDELILSEDGHVYQIIVAHPSQQPVDYSSAQLRFGPYLIQDPANKAFRQLWTDEADRLVASIQAMKRAQVPPQTKIASFTARLQEIQEVFNYDDRK